jgi:hypothetical protein
MGKKSNAKKKRRELEREEQLQKFQKSQKSQKKKKKKSSKASRIKKAIPKLRVTKKQLLGGILALIMLTILITVGYLLFQKAFQPSPIAKLLPEENTIAIIEINSNFDHNQLTKTFKLLEDHSSYSKEKLIKYIENKFLINYEEEIEPWLGRVIGCAVIKSPTREDTIDIIYFAEVFSQTSAMQYIKKQGSETNYLDQTIYIASNGKSKTLIGDYLFFANNSDAIKELIDFNNSSSTTLYDSSSYRRIDDNMPLSKTAFFYVNFNQITDNFFYEFPIFTEKGLSIEMVKPLLNLFESEGLSLIALDDKFALQSFLSLNREALKDNEYLSQKQKYKADLTKYIPSDAVAFWGGENLEYQIKRLLEALSEDSETITVFNIILQNYTQKYFGPEVDFNRDILPLFENEFAIALEQIHDQNVYKLIIELQDPSADAVRIHEIADNFAEMGAVFEPKIVEHILEDGTVTKEIVAVPEEIIEKEITYNDFTIYELKMGEQNFVIAYAIIDNTGIIATSSEGIKSAIDAKNEEIESLKSSETFETLIKPILSYSDEVSYFNMDRLSPIMFGETPPPFIEIISSISSGKNYFNDGITSINYLRIK